MEKEKSELEQLLNSLIEKGWKPKGEECTIFIRQCDPKILDRKPIWTAVVKGIKRYNIHFTIRELVSKESGLWQFVCENGMVKNAEKYYDERVNNTIIYPNDEYKYRLIEASLKDESELEQFLLNSIKID